MNIAWASDQTGSVQGLLEKKTPPGIRILHSAVQTDMNRRTNHGN